MLSVEAEELDISNDAPRPRPNQLPKPLCEDDPVILTEEHVPELQRFFHLMVREPAGGFAGCLSDLAHQMWDLTEEYYDCCEFTRRTAKASWIDFMHDSSRREHNESSLSPTDP